MPTNKKKIYKAISYFFIVLFISTIIFGAWEYSTTPDLSDLLDSWYRNHGDFKDFKSDDTLLAKDTIDSISVNTIKDNQGNNITWTNLKISGGIENWSLMIKGKYTNRFHKGDNMLFILHVIPEKRPDNCNCVSDCWQYGPFGNETLKEFISVWNCGMGISEDDIRDYGSL